MKTGYYVSPTGQATATVDGSTDSILESQGFRRVSVFRWLWMCLFVIKPGDLYAHHGVKRTS
jgi:hypothetical protein